MPSKRPIPSRKDSRQHVRRRAQEHAPEHRTSTPATVWKGSISFGLVSFPVRLSSAARAKTVHFHMLHQKDQSRIKEVWYCVEEDKPIERSDMQKGYEVSKGK